MHVNPQVPLSGEGLTHTATGKTRKVPLAPLRCGRRLGMCRAGELWELQAASSSSGVRKASARQGGNAEEQGAVRGFPPLICQAGMDGCTKSAFPCTHLLDLLLPFSPHTPHPLLFVHGKKNQLFPFSWFSLSLFVSPKRAWLAEEDDNFPWKPVEKEAGSKITSPHKLEVP